MSWFEQRWFKWVCKLVLYIFFFQGLHPGSYGYQSQPKPSERPIPFLSWGIGPAPVMAQEPPAADPPGDADDLSCTPDASCNDPYVLTKAAELGNDPQRIFEFVRDEIGYESYQGSLRGARGTLWSQAGNALDQASLLIALLRASGVPAHYVRGTLSDDLSKSLILSMFPPPLRVVGCPPDDAVRADPANDPQLLAETREHYWVELDTGGGFQAADPTLEDAQLGQTLATEEGTFAEVPDALRHKVTVRLKAEFPAGIAGTAGFSTETPLDETFNTVELVGRPLSIGHFVSAFSPPALLFGYTTYTYSPYILLGQNDGTTADYEVIRGTDYQELLTNFPLGSQFLTGLYLDIDVKSPNGTTQTYERTLLDRIGFATRQNGGAVTLSSAGQGPALSEMDLVTVNVLPGLQSLDAIANQKDKVESFQTQLDAIKPQVDAIPASGPQSPQQQAVLSEALNLTRETLVSNAEILTMAFAGAADVALGQLEQGYLTQGYYTSPRLLIALTKREADTLSVKLDLRKNDLRAVPEPGQVSGIGFAFEMARGLMESTLEGEIFTQVTGSQAISVADIFGQLGDDASLVLITKDNLQLLEETGLSATAKARISTATTAGKAILAPTDMVTIGDLTTVGWLEIDPVSGYTIGAMEDGGHQAFSQYANIIRLVPLGISLVPVIEVPLGFSSSIIIFIGNLLEEVSSGTPFDQAVRDSKLEVANFILNALDNPFGALTVPYSFGMQTALEWINRNVPYDPPVFPFLSSDLGPELTPVTPGATPNVVTQIVPDEYFTIPLNGVEVPSVFKAQIQNLGPTTDTFELSFPDIPSGFTIQSSVPQITVPPGQTGEVGICLSPTGAVGAPGSTAPFTVRATSTADPSVTADGAASFATPELPTLSLTSIPAALSSTPGTPVSATLNISSVGNVPADATLDVNASPGLTVTGLSSPVSLGVGESATQTLTLTPATSAPLNSTLTATITATYASAPGQSQTASAQVRVVVRSAETLAVEQAALAADQAANTQLADSLSTLADTLGQVQDAPTDARLWERLKLELSNIALLAQNDPSLVGFVPQLQQARDLAAAQNLSALLGLVPDLFSGVGGAFQHAFTLALSPASVALQPGQAQDFNVRLENKGTAASTVSLAHGPLPSGVTATLSQAQVTLAPGEVRDASSATPVTLTLSQSVQSANTFALRLSATVTEAPTLTQGALAYVTIRPAIADVLSVGANPAVVDRGTPVAVSAQVLNAANTLRSALARVEVRDQADTVVATLPDIPVTLTPGTDTIAVDLGSLPTDGLANGLYQLHVSLRASDGGPLPGRAAQTPLFVGMPVTATVRAEPSLVAPGTAEVVTTIEVINQLVAEGGGPISPTAKINTAIQQGLAYLYAARQLYQQQGHDWVYWPYGGYEPAATGAAVFAMLSQKSQWGENASQYQTAVDKAVDYLLSVAATYTVGVRSDGFNPCGSGTCLGVYWPAANGEITYTTGLIAPAIALYAADHASEVAITSGPLADLTWTEIAQGITNMFAASQSTAASGNRRGGWRYYPGNNDSDSSTTQWAIISMIYDETLSATTPQFVRDELKYWLTAAQYINTNLSDPNHIYNGVACYQPGVAPCDHADTGGLLVGLKFVGYDQSNFQVQAALDFLNTNWAQSANGTWYGNFGHPYAMWSVYKGLEVTLGLNDTTRITNLLDPTCGGDIPSASCNWWQDYNQWLVANQQSDGSWAGYSYWTGVLATAFDLAILGGTNIPTVTLNLSVRHQLPPSGYVVEPGSVSPPADSLSPSEVVWATRTFSTRTVTFQLNGQAPDLAPGESREVSLGTEIDAELITAGGERITVPLELPPAAIAATHTLGLDPASQTVARGAQALYTVQISNPTEAPETVTLSTVGLEAFSTTLAPSVSMPAGQTVTTPLTVDVPAGVPERTLPFSVQAQTDAGSLDTVEGQLIIQGGDPGGPPPAVALGSMAVSMDIVAVQPVAGQGTPATYRVRVTNVGTQADSYHLSASLPAGFTGAFSQDTVDVSPGLDNFREVPLTVTPAPGTPAGTFNFSVTAVSGTESSVSGQAQGTGTVVGNGVDVTLSPTTGTSDTAFQATVRNTGTEQDSFDLALAGPLAPAATLGGTLLTLPPGAAQTVAITLAPIDFADAGSLDLIAVATSRGNSAVQDSATAQVGVPTSKGMNAHFEPGSVQLPAPGTATALLLVRNTGNAEDAYTVHITGTTGPITASLSGLDGQPTQSIATFRLPGLATGAILLDAQLTEHSSGTATVEVRSLNDATITASATVLLTTGNLAPVANAGADRGVPFGQAIMLDGSRSYDPDNAPAPLSYQWTLLAKPQTSDFTTADIVHATDAVASFTPDVRGTYDFRLTVSDGAATAADDVRIDVLNNPPVADAGADRNVKTGAPVTLDGSASYDPDEDLITYEWSIERAGAVKPAGSGLTDTAIENRQGPKPTLTPDKDGDYEILLVTDDGMAQSEPDSVKVHAYSANVPPNADAGRDQTVHLGEAATLMGSGTDVDAGTQPLSYAWSFAEKPGASLLGDNAIVDRTQSLASFTPDVLGDYVLRLQVSDGAAVGSDEATITAATGNLPPTATAGADTAVQLGGEVSLSGAGSVDPDQGPEPLSYQWTFVSVPLGSVRSDADLVDAGTPTARFTPDVLGDYVLRLQVFDGMDTGADNLVVSATPALSFQDVTGRVAVTQSGARSSLDRRTRLITSEIDITLTNQSTTAIGVPLQAVISPDDAAVTMTSANGTAQGGGFVHDLGALIQGSSFAPGQQVTFQAVFVYPSNVRFGYDVKVFGMAP